MADKKTCGERVKDGSVWHSRRCGKPVKFVCLIEMTDGVERKRVKGHRCGIHARRYEKLEKL